MAAVLVLAVSCGSQHRTMTLALREGSAMKHRDEAMTSVTFRLLGESMRVTTTQRGESVYTVENVQPDGTATITERMDVQALDIQTGGSLGGMFDGLFSDNELRDLWRGFVEDLDFRFTISSDGSVSAVEGGEGLVEAMMAHLAMPVSVQQVNTRYALRESVGDDGLKERYEHFFGYLTAAPLSVGDSWTGESVFRDEMPFKLTTTYVLAAIEDGIAVIRVSGPVEALPTRSDLMGLPAGMDLSISAKGTHSGVLKVDVATGWVQDKDLNIDADGSFSISVDSGPGGQLSMPFEYQYRATTRRTS